MRLTSILATAGLSSLASTAHISGYVGPNCMGERYFGFNTDKINHCYDLTIYEQTNSLILSNFKNKEVWDLFTDNNCRKPVGRQFAVDFCYQEDPQKIKSVKLLKSLT